MRTTVDLPEPLLQHAKQLAAGRGVTLSVLVQDALQAHLARNTGAADTQFELHTVRGRLVRPDLDLDRTSALITLEDESEFTGGKR